MSVILGPEDFRASLGQLKKLYTPEFCREAIPAGTAPEEARSLFIPQIRHRVIPTFLLGVDLADASGWDEDPGMFAGLRNAREYLSRRVEVGFWASMSRLGLRVERIEESEDKTPDFTVSNGREIVAVEIKCLDSSGTDDDRDELRRLLLDPIQFNNDWNAPVFRDGGLRMDFDFDDDIVESMMKRATSASTLERLRPLVPETVTFIGNQLVEENVGRTIPVPNFGTMTLTREESRSFPIVPNLELTSLETQVKRAFRNIRDGGLQNNTDHPLVVIVHSSIFDLPIYEDPEVITDQVELTGRDENAPIRKVDGMVFHNYWWTEDVKEGKKHLGFFVRPPWSRLPEIPQWFVRCLHNWKIDTDRLWVPKRIGY